MKPEIINITSREGPLEIIGGRYDSALLLNGELIQFTYLREIGSTWRYQVARGIRENEFIGEKKFRNFVKYGYLNNDTLSDQFSYILKLLSAGKYQIEITALKQEIGSLDIKEEFDDHYCFDSYGGMEEVLETQSAYNEAIIQSYVGLINQGQEPIVILLKTHRSQNTFLIDGHHKFAAYKRLKESARCLLITKLNSQKIDKTKGLGYLEKYNSNTEYRNRFLDRI